MRLVVKQAGLKGMGVFASERIAKGTVLARCISKPRYVWEFPVDIWERLLQVGRNRYVCPRRNSTMWFVNHSCEPNCEVTGDLRLRAIRDLEADEEATFDYSENVTYEGFFMKCKCGSLQCRGFVLGRDIRRSGV